MKSGNGLNSHGQPFSKKQKRASRSMMANRGGFDRAPSGKQLSVTTATPGVIAGLMAMLLGRRRARR